MPNRQNWHVEKELSFMISTGLHDSKLTKLIFRVISNERYKLNYKNLLSHKLITI